MNLDGTNYTMSLLVCIILMAMCSTSHADCGAPGRSRILQLPTSNKSYEEGQTILYACPRNDLLRSGGHYRTCNGGEWLTQNITMFRGIPICGE